MLKLSVIVPTFNRRHVLERTLRALEEQDLPTEDYEVIVVIDGSTDGTADLLRDWNPAYAFRAVGAPHRGPGAARNVGIQAAMGELLLFLDDDLTGIPDLLRQHCASHSGPEARIVHGPIYIAPESSRTMIRHTTELFYETYYRNLDPDMVLRYPGGIATSLSVVSSLVNSSMPREIALRCGGFDEEILAAEDLEFGLRLWKLGLSFRYRPTAIAYEYYRKSSAEYLNRQAKALGAGDLLASRKHPEYRPHSSLSAMAEMPAWKQWLRNALVRFPLSPVGLIALPLHWEEWFYRFPPMRRIGTRLLRGAERIARLRSSLSVAGSWKALQSEFGRTCPSLLYHHIGPSYPGTYDSLTVSPGKFERQIRWLAHQGYVGITSSDWQRWLRDGKGLPEKPILITFDDGYADTAEYAFPILRRYGFGATMFVVTGRFGGTNTWDEEQGCGTLQLMTAEQIRTWAGQGIEFGAHSRTHPNLTKLPPDECLAEIAGSKNDLATLLGSPVACFAYPFGEQNQAVSDLVRGEFEIAFGIEEGINDLHTDPHLLRRAYVAPYDSLLGFAFCVWRGGIKWTRDLRFKIRLRTRLRAALSRLS